MDEEGRCPVVIVASVCLCVGNMSSSQLSSIMLGDNCFLSPQVELTPTTISSLLCRAGTVGKLIGSFRARCGDIHLQSQHSGTEAEVSQI
jgi:hypothetical protein